MSWPFSSYCALGAFWSGAAASSARQGTRTRTKRNSFFIDYMMRTHRSHGFALLILVWVCRSIRPSAHGNHEYVDWFRIAMELWIQHHGRVVQIGTPNGAVHEWSVNHHVSYPVVLPVIGKVL